MADVIADTGDTHHVAVHAYHAGGTYRLLTHERECYRVRPADQRAFLERERAYWQAQVTLAERSLESSRAKLAEAEARLGEMGR